MAEELFYNQPMLDAFKREIQFDKIIDNPPEDKFILVDWSVALKEFQDSEGIVWRLTDMSTYEFELNGGLRSSIESKQGRIDIQVHSIPKGQAMAIEFALRTVATTSMDYVNWRDYQPCFSDFCLTPLDSKIAHYFLFVYGNISIQLDYWDVYDTSVLPVARYLQSVMEKAVAANPDKNLPLRPSFIYTVNEQQVNAKKSFTLTVKPGESYSRALWDFDVAQDLLSDNIEYEEELGDNTYKFTAKSAGKGTIVFSLMDRKTLYLFTDTVSVNIE